MPGNELSRSHRRNFRLSLDGVRVKMCLQSDVDVCSAVCGDGIRLEPPPKRSADDS
jgi:hypothetical protein